MFAFAGAGLLSAMFSVLCSMIVAIVMTAFLCLVFDCEWDSDLGVAISTSSAVLSIPFTPFALKFAENWALPKLGGFCGYFAMQILAGMFEVSDEYLVKSSLELLSFLGAFVVSSKF